MSNEQSPSTTKGQRYTREEIDFIAEEYEAGTPVEDIAYCLDRTVNSIVSAARQRGMRHPNKTKHRREEAA